MTVSSTVRQAGPFVGDALTTVFPFAFKCFSKTDLVLTLTVIASGAQTTLLVDSDFTVALNADQDASPGGSITYNPLGVPMPATSNLTITSAVPQSQTVTLTIGGGFFPTVISQALDRIVILVQELTLRFTRGLSVAIGDTVPGLLPNAAARALKYLTFDGSGNPTVSSGGASTPVSGAMAPVVAAATLAAGRTALGLSSITYPSFSVNRNAVAQAIPNNTPTKIQFTTEEFDTNANFDNVTNYRFTPTIAGKYLITLAGHYTTAVDNTPGSMTIYKNGAAYEGIQWINRGTSAQGTCVSAVVDFNGSTDYVEFYAQHTMGGPVNLDGGNTLTRASGIRIN